MNYINVLELAEKKGYNLKYPHLLIASKDFIDRVEIGSYDDLFVEITLIQKWLRDTHKIAVLISLPLDVYYRYSIEGINGNGYYSDSSYKEKKDFVTYEEALLQGIKESLLLI